MTTATDYSLQEEQSYKFFKEIKNELGVTSSRNLVKLVRGVLSHVRSTLTHEQASFVINALPDIFKLLFVTNWKYEKTSSPIKHLDELVDHIYLEDRKQNNSLFSSEVDTLNAVIIVLGKLDKFFGVLGLNLFHYPLTQELKQAATQEEYM